VRVVSDRSGIDINKVAKAFYDTTSNQVAKGTSVAPFVQQATDLARVTGSELPDAVNLLSSRINAYGLSAADAEKISAQFFRTIDEGRVVASEMANTLGRVDVIASNLGISMEEVNAVIAITTQKGFKTADAMTLLTNLMTKLEKPTEATAAFFESLGVSTGEAAIKLYGFTGVMQRMVTAVQTGQVSVSAFFDEIRGRKQFGVFEQSIGQIEAFKNKLQNTTDTIKVYQNAITIRGESSADKLVKEFNKVKNIFTVDFGQGLLKGAANLLEFTGGIDSLSKAANTTGKVLGAGVIALTAYGVSAVGAAAANAGLAGSFGAVATAGLAASRVLLPLLAAAGGYSIGKKLFGAGEDDVFGRIDPKNLNATADALERVNQKILSMKDNSKGVSPFAALDAQVTKVEDTYRNVLGLVSKATIANNKFLDEAKSKGKIASDAIKVGFDSYTSGIQNNINTIKKSITEAQNEIEKSKKSMISFGDSVNQTLFNTKFKYANENFGGDFGQIGGQKDLLLAQRAADLRAKAQSLFQTGDKDNIAEARTLYEELVKIEQQRFELQTDLQKKQAEAAGATGIFLVDTTALEKKLNGIIAERQGLEDKYTKSKAAQVEQNTLLSRSEEQRLDKLKQAFKAYQDLDIFNKNGDLKAEYKDKGGKFDPEKLGKDLARIEKDIEANAGSGFNIGERLQLEQLLFDKRKALFAEAQAQERADYLKTAEQRLLAESDVQKKQLDNIKKTRQEELDKQKNILNALGAKPQELAGFANNATAAGGVSENDKVAIANSVGAYRDAVNKLITDQAIKDGVKVLKPENVQAVKDAYGAAITTIEGARNRAGKQAALTQVDQNGREITPGGARAATDLQIEELLQSFYKVQEGITQEKVSKTLFDQQIAEPLKKLTGQFPELANTAKDAASTINKSFSDLANGGLEDLRKKLQDIQDLLNATGAKKISAEIGTSDDAQYFAEGGMIGAFPGKPRGEDRYPIWAARGEYIVNARSTAMFKPMLEAINNARTPRYMASGGMVGSNTNIGDINVYMNNSGATNNDTGRAIAHRIERELRRRTINLNRK
jgi:TP901 family phage tail tape measure protein